MLKDYITPVVKKLAEEKREETAEQASLRLSTALIVVCIIQTHNVTIGRETTTPLFRALLLQPDHQSKTCPDFDALCKIHFPMEAIRTLVYFTLLIYL